MAIIIVNLVAKLSGNENVKPVVNRFIIGVKEVFRLMLKNDSKDYEVRLVDVGHYFLQKIAQHMQL